MYYVNHLYCVNRVTHKQKHVGPENKVTRAGQPLAISINA
jgi:hypothetical protein